MPRESKGCSKKVDVKIGDCVMIHMLGVVKGKAWKFARPFHGPYRVIGVTPTNVEVKLCLVSDLATHNYLTLCGLVTKSLKMESRKLKLKPAVQAVQWTRSARVADKARGEAECFIRHENTVNHVLHDQAHALTGLL